MENLYFLTLSNLLSVLLLLVVVRGEIGVNCGSGAVGQPYELECTNIPDTVTNGVKVFLVNASSETSTSNGIVICSQSDKSCFSTNSSLYSVESPHNESLYFTILNLTTDGIGKKVFCIDGATLDPTTQKPSCLVELLTTTTVPTSTSTDVNISDGNNDGLTGGEIAGIVIGVLVICSSCIICIVCVVLKKKKGKKERRQN